MSRKRSVLALAFMASILAIGAELAACTQGTTPDCSLPDAGCGPMGDGSVPETTPLGDGGGDASDAGDAHTQDAPTDAQDSG
jgi:hypothetical protein